MNRIIVHSEGLLLVDKPRGKTSFSLVAALRKRTGIQKIGHSGTLDPFATGVMVLLVGKKYTRLCDQFLTQDKEYLARLHLGISTNTFDCKGQATKKSGQIPSLADVGIAISHFQGTIQQIPPMFSAKKIGGQKLYDLARKGKTIERPPITITLTTTLLEYNYPYLDLQISCSKGTYIRSLADTLGELLGCGGHLIALTRTRSGSFHLAECLKGDLLYEEGFDPRPYLKHHAYLP